ncbi:MAG TPA: chemotaxis protein CheW [Burkholderiales bacterium]|nr:chemotaxis protein CheW [Burkholderiales bacterium]
MSNTGQSGGSSSIDMSQFYQVFFEEAEEHLSNMESLLLSIDPAEASGEELNAIFRAAHSIKGGSGTFGFNDMTEVTHILESLLDRVRKNEMILTTEMVDALLASGDVLKAQLARHRGQGGEPPDASGVCERVKSLMNAGGAKASAPAKTASSSQHAAERDLEIRFPEPAADVDAAAVQDLYDTIGQLGAMTGEIESKDGQRSFQYRTRKSDKELRNLFAFVCDTQAVEIIDPQRAKAEDEAGFGLFGDAEPAKDDSFGFFDELPALPSATTVKDDSFGFFGDDAPGLPASVKSAAAPAADPSIGRRATDHAAADARSGRRETDKNVAAAQDTSIRVSVEKVDQLINQVGELVITQAMLAQAVSKLDPLLFQQMLSGMADLERNTRDLQESVMSIRMLPIGFVFKRFPRMVRDLAGKLNKQVQLLTEGEGTELDKGLIEKIADPLNHLIRNSVDHGIEMPDARVAAGKPAQGTVTLRASHQGGSILIEVVDDGKGLDREKILAKGRERGLPVSDSMSDGEVWGLIFEAGFSTADKVTDISGRGVGMDVVKRNIAELGGTVEIESATGHGTRMKVRLPLTLAIIDGMSVAVGEDVYIIPLATVVESLQAGSRAVRSVAGGGFVVEIRDEYLPVISLHDLFPNDTAAKNESKEGIMLVVESEGVKNAFLVDELLGQQQVVVKSLESNYRRVPGVSGATIMGDGRVALILDVPTLVRMSRH